MAKTRGWAFWSQGACRTWESWEAREQPLPPSTHTMPRVRKHHPASCELTVPQATCHFSHSFPKIKFLAQEFAPLICKIELSLVMVTRAHPWWQRTSEVTSALVSEITAGKWKRHQNTNDNIRRWKEEILCLKGAQATFLDSLLTVMLQVSACNDK